MVISKFIFIFSFFIMTVSFADDATSRTINIKGNVYFPSSCKLNDGENLNIDFGKVGVTKIDGVSYQKSVVIPVSCLNSGNKQLRLKLVGTSSANKNILITGNKNLGLKIIRNGLAFNLNEWVVIQPNSNDKFTFELFVTPIKINTSEILDVGIFGTTATLISTLD